MHRIFQKLSKVDLNKKEPKLDIMKIIKLNPQVLILGAPSFCRNQAVKQINYQI
jgi:hypothetical protein